MVANHRYKKIVWSNHKGKENDTLYLTSKDLHHLNRIYKKYQIHPETIDYVRVEFLLQREKLARFIIKELDVLLKVGGQFEILIIDNKAHSCFIRSRDQVQYEMSLSTNGRYKKIYRKLTCNDQFLYLIYKKTKACLPKEDIIEKWSFGIITNGKKNKEIERLIASIIYQKIPNYEILICGPFENVNNHEYLTILDDIVAIEDEIRAPICAKKNKIIYAAKYNNLCILHDRFFLPDEWYLRFKDYGNFFDFLCLPTVSANGIRFKVDWMKFCSPVTRSFSFANRSMTYNQWSPEQIIQGGVILGKKHWIEQSMLDERLFWEELEDMHFSKHVNLNGAFINTDILNYFISEAVNHKPVQENWYARFMELIEKLYGISRNVIRYYFYYYKRFDLL